jgi:predicted nucleic acid-binding protein
LLLDSGPLNRLLHPNASVNQDVTRWLIRVLDAGAVVVLPEIADYETRRSLIWLNAGASIAKLDRLKADLWYLPLTTPTLLRAANLWAQARRLRRPTADDKALDGDMILAAQALEIGGLVVTENPGHLGLFVETKTWQDIR